MNSPVPLLRRLALIEGVSFLILLFIAMPLKYLAAMPMAVVVTGWIHGVLFVLFGLALVRTKLTAGWPLSRCAMVFVAALLPFGPFVIDRRMAEWSNAPDHQ